MIVALLLSNIAVIVVVLIMLSCCYSRIVSGSFVVGIVVLSCTCFISNVSWLSMSAG